MSTLLALASSLLLLAGNAFFVAVEFALVAARRHRLEQAAAAGERGATAAIAGVRQLSLTLAGAQLGITLCTLGLGALAEPAVAHLLEDLLHTAGLPEAVSYAIGFTIALAVVVFLHMVVGEMAPKSWAITDPQRSALLLAPVFGWYTRAVRPVIAGLNAIANACLRLIRVQPQDELAQAHGPDELRMLLEASREHGLLPVDAHLLLSRMLRLQQTTLTQVLTPREHVVSVPSAASASAVERASRDTGRSRLLVLDPAGRITGMVHVREALRATTAGRDTTAAELATAVYTLPADRSVLAAVRHMREAGAQLAVVTHPDDAGTPAGVVALEDLLEEFIGDFDDETDPRPMAGRA